jgi:signal transduction histidine kinase
LILLLGVVAISEDTTTVALDGADATAVEVSTRAPVQPSPWTTGAVVAFGPVAAALAWWLAGRAVRPIEHVRTVAEEIEASDLGRRIGIDRGPTEVVALAASFDSMLDRLEDAADTQRRLIEETSHELRTPLSVLATNTDVLLAHPEPTVEVYREGLERSKAAIGRVQATIDELLVEARGRARTIDRRPTDLMALAREVTEDAQALVDARGIHLDLVGPRTATCAVDEPTLRRALANLVDNAVRAAPDRSSVEVRVVVTDDDATLVVSDRGPGIPIDEQARVFERYWRGRTDVTGAGLGLSIAQQVAVAHGGDLTVVSPGPSGDGCAFHLRVRR